MTRVNVRPFEIMDIASYINIENEVIKHEKFDRQRFVDILSREDIVAFSAIYDKKLIAGYTILQIKARQLIIIELNIKPHYQRRSIGQMLYSHIEQLALHLKLSRIIVQLESENNAAINFFIKQKFSKKKKLKNYLIPGNQGIEMIKKII